MEYLLIALIFSNLVTLCSIWIIVRRMTKVEKNIPSVLNEMESNLKRMIKESSLKKICDYNQSSTKSIYKLIKELSSLYYHKIFHNL